MKVVMCRPNEYATIEDIDLDLHSLYKALDAEMIQAVYPWADPVALVCDEEGKLTGKELCRALCAEDGHIYDIVAGTFVICGLRKDNFAGLSDKLAQKYLKMFECPEAFIRTPHGLAAIRG